MQRDGRAGGVGRPPSESRRSTSVQRSSSAQRRGPSVGLRAEAERRPPSRISDSGSQQVSPSSEGGQPPRIGARPSPEPVYNVNNAREAQISARRAAQALPAQRGPLGSAGAAVSVKPTRSSSTGPSGGRSSSVARGVELNKTPLFVYLKLYGLNQYARAFIEGGLSDMEAIGRLSETEAMEFLERLRVYPGHRLRLLRAIDCLRHAVSGADRRDAAQMLEDDAALERLCQQKEELSKEKSEAENESRRLQDENSRLLQVVREQGAQLQKSRDRIGELEELVQSQTEQVAFLANQLQMIADKGPEKANELYKSYKGSFEDTHDADWHGAQPIQLPEVTSLPTSGEVKLVERMENADLSKPQAFTPADFGRAAPSSAPAPASRGDITQSPRMGRSQRGIPAGFKPPLRSKMAQSMDSAQIRDCIAGFDVDHIIKCLAAALQNHIILAMNKSRPHSCSAECLAACSIFLEPACREKLEMDAARRRDQAHLDALNAAAAGEGGSDLGTPLSSICSPLMSKASASIELRDSMGKPFNPLNAIAMRNSPNKWDIYGFLRDVMVNFRLEPEVSVVTLVYVQRFCELSGVALTPDNWQRLVIAAMMLASKVWNDESFENVEFAQLCPLYTLDEINTFERIFLKCVGYNMSVKGSQYAQTYFLLRTLGAKDSADFTMEPLTDLRASRLQERCLEKQIEFRERYPEDMANLMNWTL